MSTHQVIANEGFISPPMSAYEAYLYSRQLNELGNYGIHIMDKREAEAYRVRKFGGIG